MSSFVSSCIHKFTGLPLWRHADSFKGRLTALSCGLSVTVIWALVSFATTIQRQELSAVLFDQQLATARYIAADLDSELSHRLKLLALAAARFPGDLSPQRVEAYLNGEEILRHAFSGGVTVIGLDGMAIADIPPPSARRGIYFGDRAYFRKAVETERPYVDKPFMDGTSRRFILPVSVPVFDQIGKVRAVIAGATDLSSSDFLGHLVDSSSGGKGLLHVISPRDGIIIASSDTARFLTPLPRRGADPLYDRFAEGFEGSGIAPGPDGNPKLYSASRVPSANWLVIASLPAELAFQPIATMRNYLVALAALLTLLVVLLAHWLTRRIFAPLDLTGRAMRQMTQGEAPLALLPVKRKDEIGGMVENVNALIEGRRRSESALAESEERLRALGENSTEAILVHAHGCFVYVNPAALRLFGASTSEELLGKPIVDFVHPDSRQIVEARIRSVSIERQSAPQMEFAMLRLDGSVLHGEVSTVPYTYDNENASLAFVRDITERKRAEQALRESEERFHRLVALSSEWYWETDERYRISRVSGWGTAMKRDIVDAILGRTPENMGISGDEAIWRARYAVMRARLPFRDLEYMWKAPNGKIAWHSISGEPTFDEHGAFKGYRGTGRDITEKKRAEQALRHSRARIRELVDHQVQIKEDERKRIARDIHDELGQTLLVLRIDTSMLAQRAASSYPELHVTMKMMLEHIDSAIKSVKAIINNLRPSVMDLGLMPSIEWQVKEFQRTSGVVCELEVDDPDFDRYLDEKRCVALFRVLQESLTNILQHARASRVRITVRVRHEMLEMIVADNGIGIAPGARRKKNSFGLVGAEERIVSLDGAFVVDSEPGRGTRLVFSIPLHAPEEFPC
ncbi:MAG TPA: PAS domain S-box protein [Noviherbaspirillum sp.]|uniref:PAS domain S-box protein n=1 Tax=Noviherbaspirillum sp. TaxID=1926288 RepID=UPI002B475DBC|nr:PAS domain S-box protein [Noviherbaspirillum sp.]HJV84239.1 PAS domain S-box protein [Noviherbaspirillum sp.]